MSIFTSIAAADTAISKADEARTQYASDMAQAAATYASALYPKGMPSAKGGRLSKALQAVWDDAKAEFVAAGVPDNDEAPRKAVSRLGMVALIIAANPQGDDETEAHFHARIIKARTLVYGGDSALIAAAISGETVAPKARQARPRVAPVTDEADTDEADEASAPVVLAPIDVLADALKAYVQASGALLDALKACEAEGVRVPKARRTLAESNARMVLEAMTA